MAVQREPPDEGNQTMTTITLSKSVTTTTHTFDLEDVPENVLTVTGGEFHLTGAVVTIKEDEKGTKVTLGVVGQMTYPSGQTAKVTKAGLFNPATTAPGWMMKAVESLMEIPESESFE